MPGMLSTLRRAASDKVNAYAEWVRYHQGHPYQLPGGERLVEAGATLGIPDATGNPMVSLQDREMEERRARIQAQIDALNRFKRNRPATEEEYIPRAERAP